MSAFKRFRPRRVDEDTRDRYRETRLQPADFILPLFLVEGRGIKQAIPSMPGVYHYSADALIPDLHHLRDKGLSAILLFGVPEHKGLEQAWDDRGIVQQAIPQIRAACPGLEIITDVCLCSYTPDGHCHVGDNDSTIEILARVALSHARAGADTVAPSDMMDGRVWAIRQALDREGLNTPIMSYAAKYASSFYGPFRDAADCAPSSGDRRGYQMDPPNGDEAMEEIAADIEEGAASVIIKPALSYLDIIHRARSAFKVPVVAYNVSGEYTMVNNMIKKGLAREEMIEEVLVSIKRAGAQRIISYWTPRIIG